MTLPHTAWPYKLLSGCFMAVVTMVWSAGTLFMDCVIAGPMLGGIRSYRFSTVEGKVINCRVEKTGKLDDEVHRVKIRYAYLVDNVRYIGDDESFGGLKDHDEVARFVAEHPADSSVVVHYDPADPTTAVLIPGLSGEQVFMVLFSLPFNAVMVLLWTSLIGKALLSDDAQMRFVTGVRIIDHGDEVRIRLPRVAPAPAAFFAAFGGAGIIIVVAGPLVFISSSLALPLATALLIAVLGGIVVTYAVVARRIASGKSDFVIDHLQETFVLPQTFGRNTATALPLRDLVAIQVVETPTKDSDGFRKFVYYVSVQYRDASSELMEEKLMKLDVDEAADDLAAMIREKTGLTALGSD